MFIQAIKIKVLAYFEICWYFLFGMRNSEHFWCSLRLPVFKISTTSRNYPSSKTCNEFNYKSK